MSFLFTLKQPVVIAISGEIGEILGRAEYVTTPLNSYLVRYKTGNGVGAETWWTEDALVAAHPIARAPSDPNAPAKRAKKRA